MNETIKTAQLTGMTCRDRGSGRWVQGSRRGRLCGLAVVVAIVIFTVGMLAGICIIMAAGIRTVDRASMRRRHRSLVLRDEPTNPAERGVRRLEGVGQRVRPERDDQ